MAGMTASLNVTGNDILSDKILCTKGYSCYCLPWYIIVLIVVGGVAVQFCLLWNAFQIGELNVIRCIRKCPPEELDEVIEQWRGDLRSAPAP
jgi:hypothetical protein